MSHIKWMSEICLFIIAKMLRNIVAGNTTGKGAWRRQGEAVKVSDLDGTISCLLYTSRCV